ncbi:hypothetical protein C0989_006008 [Termitomyces sp. Mn162]|nr:hypothetical protein C0989_006008 [Termitomyces sp. Mn162]
MEGSSLGRSKPEHVLPSAFGGTTSLNTTGAGFSSLTRKNVKKPPVLQERTNSTTMYPGATSLYEARVNFVELPTPTRVIAHNVAPPRPNPTVNQRRMQRYSAAEEVLAKQFEKCQSETSPANLQIRALKEVTSMLSAHARDARERAEKLRGLLADRDMDPEAYESLQRERWFQEHRRDAAAEEAKAVQQQLSILSNGSTQTNISDGSKGTDDEERRRRNLIKFLADSSKRPSVRIRKTTSVIMERSQNRRTMDKVSPMRLRTTFVISRTSVQPSRPMSLDGWIRRSRRISNLAAPTPLHVPSHSLNLVSEDDLDEVVSPPTETASSFTSIFTTKSFSSIPPSTAITLPTSLPTSSTTEAENENGTAIILLDTHLSKAHYKPRDIDAPLPDYVLDLFARFDYDIDINFSNTPRRHPSAGSGHRPVRPQKSTPLPPSSYLQVPSFSPPKHSERKSSRLGRSPSHRHLSTLFSIPEAISSRIGINTGVKRVHQEAVPSDSPSKFSLASSSGVSEETKMNNITTRIKKRFSLLRLRRPS